jgi:thiol-disulfide isomerase/thioredoxin
MTLDRRFAALAHRTVAVILVALAPWLAACGPKRSSQGAGDPLPEFRLASIAGGELGSRELAGKVVVYDFWATWCGPCHLQAEILHEMYPDHRGDDVEFVAISVGEPEEIVREFLAEKPYPYPVLVDPEDSMSTRLRILGLPTLIVADRDGRVVFRSTGISDRRTIEKALERAGA